jgi:transcriptional regulator with XRE-family HTH domain
MNQSHKESGRDAAPRPAASRSIGVRIDPEAFERELAARGLEAKDLAKLTGLKADTFSKARHGRRVTRDTLMRIAFALEKVPVHRVAAALVKVDAAPAQRKHSPSKKVA